MVIEIKREAPFGTEFIVSLRERVNQHMDADRMANAKRLAEALTVVCAEYPEARKFADEQFGAPWWAGYDRSES
jgi:hypothetical protein